MSAAEIIPLAVPLAFALMLVGEERLAARQFPQVRHWRRTGVVFLIQLLGISLIVGALIPAEWLRKHRLIDLSTLGLWGAAPALLVTSFVTYFFHRAEHRFDWMWRAFHQLHHSAQRVDIAGAYYTHPLEPAIKMALGAIVAVMFFGLDPVAAAITSTLTGLLSLFQHWNIATPHWLGFFIPRPESHCLHHERGVHGRNYGDLPIWDMLFGTYSNPRATASVEAGFGKDATGELGRMLLMRDVHTPQAAVKSDG